MRYTSAVIPTGPDAPPAAPRTRRRRGRALSAAIFRAALDELARTSFEELAFDKIAARAGTGKAALYRRWSTPAELVLAALDDPEAGFGAVPVRPGTGTLRGDLIAVLSRLVRGLDEPRGRALRPLIAERHRHPELFDDVRRLVLEPHLELVMDVLRAAVERGEARPGCVTALVASVGPRLVVIESWERDRVTDQDVVRIVDEVLVPLTSPAASA